VITKKIDVLECGRGLAAFYVFLHHLEPLKGTRFDVLFRFGQEAVILFFLISGFVIYLSFHAKKEVSARAFLFARFLRIYPVFLLCLLLAFGVSSLNGRSDCGTVDGLLGNLLMLQDRVALQPGALVAPFCHNQPLWSLSYEWWFYCGFAALLPLLRTNAWEGIRRIVATVCVGGLAAYVWAPSQPAMFAAYFSLWWAGVELAREYLATGRTSFRSHTFSLLLLVAGLLVLMAVATAKHLAGDPIRFGYPALQLRHFAAGIVAMMFAIWLLSRERKIGTLMRPLLWLAPISYGLYISHYPLLSLLSWMGFEGLAKVVVAIPVCLAVAFLFERVAHPWIVFRLRPTRRLAEQG
jgi:peptidoglycan/LPS O-acetylase OafA/YrhL